jgi:predicted dehydrogenase
VAIWSAIDPVNVLLIGIGRWGEKHLRVLRELGAVVWAADVDPARRAWATAHGVDPGRVMADFRVALPHVEAVDIVTPAASHRAILEVCLGAGRHCFVEKPLTATAAEARAIVALAAAHDRVLQVGHIFRFHPATTVLREALAVDRIGVVRYVTGRFAGFKRPRPDMGVTHTDAIHYFDLFAYLLERPPSRVTALQRDFLGRGLDDLSMTIVHYGDVPAIVEASYFVPGRWRECVIVGERGSLVADLVANTVTLWAGEHRRQGAGWVTVDAGKESLTTADAEPLRLELQAFRDACASGGPSPVSGADGIGALEVVEAAALAARLGRTVSLAEVREPAALAASAGAACRPGSSR